MASSLRATIQQLAANFAAGVLGAIRGSSLEEILAETGGAKRGPGRPPKQPLDFGAAAGRGRRAATGKGVRLGRRSADAIEGLADDIVDLLARHPKGLRAEQIRSELGISAKELPRPISKALESRRIKKVGQKRATTYFSAGSAPSRPDAAPKRARAGKSAGRTAATEKPHSVAKRPPPSPDALPPPGAT